MSAKGDPSAAEHGVPRLWDDHGVPTVEGARAVAAMVAEAAANLFHGRLWRRIVLPREGGDVTVYELANLPGFCAACGDLFTSHSILPDGDELLGCVAACEKTIAEEARAEVGPAPRPAPPVLWRRPEPGWPTAEHVPGEEFDL